MPASLKHLSGPQGNIKSILARWSDGKFYRAVKRELDVQSKKCLVKFEDGLEAWLATTELHLELAIDDIQDEDIVCCVCDDGTSAEPNEIIMCDGCQQGYHVQCHQPNIDRERVKLEDDLVEWFCSTCDQLIALAKNKPVKIRAVANKTPATPSKEAGARKAATQTKSKSTGKVKADAKKRPSTPMVKSGAAKIKLGKKHQTASNGTKSPDTTPPVSQSTADAPESSESTPVQDDQKTDENIVAAFETVRIKKTEKKRPPVEDSPHHDSVEEPLLNGNKVQKEEQSLILEAAQTLSENVNTLVDTKAFTEVVCGISKSNKAKSSKSKLPTGAGKRKNNVEKSNPPETAAAY